MINIFVCTCPNRSGVGAIDNPDQFEQASVQYYIPEDPEKIFTHDISMVRRQKICIFDVLKTFISKITYYTLYSRKLEVIARKKYALRFSIGPLRFSLGAPEDLLNLLESLEKNVEIPWKNKGHTSSAQRPQVSFSKAFSIQNL